MMAVGRITIVTVKDDTLYDLNEKFQQLKQKIFMI